MNYPTNTSMINEEPRVLSKSLSETVNQLKDANKKGQLNSQKDNSNKQLTQFNNFGLNNSVKQVDVKIEPGCESSPYSEDITLLSKSEMSENPVQEEVSKRVWRKFAKRFNKVYELDKKRAEKEAIELELLVRSSFKESQLYKDMIVKIIKMIDEHQRRIHEDNEIANFTDKQKLELMGLFHQEKKRAECLDELSSEKNQDMLEENLIMSDGEKQIDFTAEFHKQDLDNTMGVDKNDLFMNIDKNNERNIEVNDTMLTDIMASNDLLM